MAATVLALEGLGVLKLGEMAPAGSGWAERGAQIPGRCRTVSSPDFPGVYAIVEEGMVRRITIGERGLKDGQLEYQHRRDTSATKLAIDQAFGFITSRLGK